MAVRLWAERSETMIAKQAKKFMAKKYILVASAPPAEKEKIHFMKEAIRAARKALALSEVPIGCVIVRGGKVIARGYNRRMTDKSTPSHAEMTAIKKACKKIGDWRLEDCEMYVTLEPCPMCAGAIIEARIPKVYIGCLNPKAGSAGSVIDLFHIPGFNHQTDCESGICQDECSRLIKDFFKKLRNGQVKSD